MFFEGVVHQNLQGTLIICYSPHAQSLKTSREKNLDAKNYFAVGSVVETTVNSFGGLGALLCFCALRPHFGGEQPKVCVMLSLPVSESVECVSAGTGSEVRELEMFSH